MSNQTEYSIDSVFIRPVCCKANSYIKLTPNKKMNYTVDMKNTPVADGHWILGYKIGDSLAIDNFGYYSNGSAMEKRIDISIH